MKALTGLAVALLGIAPLQGAAEEKPKAEAPALATAEDLLAAIENQLHAEDEGEEPKDEKEVAAHWQKKLAAVDQSIAEFRKRFAVHPLRWKVMFLEAAAQDIRGELNLPLPKGSRTAVQIYGEILAAPDADSETRAQASSARLIELADAISEKKGTVAEWEKQLEKHLKDHADFEENMMLVEMRVMLVQEHANARFIPLLEEMSKHPVTEIAEMAKNRLAMERTKAELKSKPLDLKFKAVDGGEVDLEKLRGKVVLVDFWATWCGPCMAELPTVVETYAKLKGKGFEIIGISLDEDEAELKRVVQAKQITWPQYFDGKGWENPYAKKYGIDGIPAMWLVNKAGMVVDMAAQDGLMEKVEKLIAE